MKQKNTLVAIALGALCIITVACDNKPVANQAAVDGNLDNRIRDESVRWGKTLAQTKCTICHDESNGKPGQETPFIGSQNANYLLSSLSAYSNGDRTDEDKQRIMAGMSAEEKAAVAAYYASLPTKWDGKNTVDRKRFKDLREPELISKGKAVATPCISCHGPDGNSEKSGIPSLAGLQPSYFAASLRAYLDGTRQGADVMKNFKLALTETNIKQLAAFFANQQRTSNKVTGNQGNAKSGANKAQTCFGCHGEDGNSYNPAFPGISGQNTAYLQKALNHYRNGSRKGELMQQAVRHLSDRDVDDIAAYFATQTPISLLAVVASNEQNNDPIAAGKQLANACNGCHGTDGISTQAGVPRLAGLAGAYLMSAIDAYKTGQRQHDMMRTQVNFLDSLDIEKIAFYYSAQNPQVKATPDGSQYLKANVEIDAPPTPAQAPEVAATCNGCHGQSGNSSNAEVPSLAGQNSAYLERAIKAYQNGTRTNKDMQEAVNNVGSGDTKTLSVYYAGQIPQQTTSRLPETPEQLAAKCDRCHGIGGTVADAKMPRIAGQAYPYLLKVLNQYQNSNRSNSTMHKMTAILSQTEIQAMAQYYAGK